MPRTTAALGAVLALAALAPVARAADPCRSGDFALSDARDVAAVRAAVERACPCASFDGSTPDKRHAAYVRCAKTVIDDAGDGTPVLGAFTLRRQCKGEVKKAHRTAACGYAVPRVMCCEAKVSVGRTGGRALDPARCADSPNGLVARHACYASPFAPDACRFDATNQCRTLVVQETVNIPSAAEAANTPGSTAVVVTNPKLLAQFGGSSFSLNNARYTRHRLAGPAQQPDAILVLVPGFEGGAGDFTIIGEDVITRANAEGFVVEVWAFDRRTNQLEDMVGLDLAEEFLHAEIALDWLRVRTAARSSTTRRATCRSSPTGRTWYSRGTSTPSSRPRAPWPVTRTSSWAATRRGPGSRRATRRPTST
jgi:hypothetical protein